MDPLAELAYDFTPYRYGFNNPVYFIDVKSDYIYIYHKGYNYKFI